MPSTQVPQLKLLHAHRSVGEMYFSQILLGGGELRGHFVAKKVTQHLQRYQGDAMRTCFQWRGKKTHSIGTAREKLKVG